MKNLHIYGHSMIKRARNEMESPTFVDILFKKYNLTEENYHMGDQGSEERLLYFLKKTWEVEYAIIFHSQPSIFFVPTLERDFTVMDEDDYFWHSKFFSNIKYFPNVTKDKKITEEEKQNPKFISKSRFKEDYYTYLKHFHTYDLNATRHYGALMQIDQYIAYKKIKAIHCILPTTCPTWYNITTGIVDDTIQSYQYQGSPYHCHHMEVANSITAEGNEVIANKLIEYLESL